MKAAVCREFGKPLVIEDINVAPPGAGEVKVDIAACAICHSDILYADGGWGGVLPAVYGHEAAGVVAEVGDGIADVCVGDHVVVTLIRSCGTCYSCSHGHQTTCETTFPLDQATPLHSHDGENIIHGLRTGGFAEQAVVHHSQVAVIPKDVPLDSASLISCGVLTGLGAVVNTAGVKPGESVVVIGTGGVGLNSVQGAVLSGAETVIAVDLDEGKLEAAKQFGATHGLNATSKTLVEDVRALTNGLGANWVFVAVGAKPAIEQAPDLLRANGTVVLVGMPPVDVMAEFDPLSLASDQKRIIGSKMGSSRVAIDVPNLVGLYQQGRLKLDELISGRYALEDINEAIASVKRGDALRNVIVF